jgi:hypothetical protein
MMPELKEMRINKTQYLKTRAPVERAIAHNRRDVQYKRKVLCQDVSDCLLLEEYQDNVIAVCNEVKYM